MAARDLSVSSMRTRQSSLSSFCTWLVKREALQANPVAGMDRPPHRIEAPKQVPTRANFPNNFNVVVPTGFEPVSEP
jgi:site-specific recombinase XerC